MSRKYLVVGAGFSGAVLARELVESSDCTVDVIDERPHVAGNCHTERDVDSGVLVHVYGPHIFHTQRENVWAYVNRFGAFRPFVNRVKASTHRGVFSLPINLHTINQFFGKRFSPKEAKAFLETLGDSSIGEPKNFEEQALKMLGRELYETFFYGYTKKQWGCEPRELPASILKRLPVRFNYDDNYYNDPFQGLPEEGYTAIVGRILQHRRIRVTLRQAYVPGMEAEYDHLFYTGPIDRFFGYSEGRLGYRTVFWEHHREVGDYQGNPVINYPDFEVPYTRVIEHKHFSPWESHENTIVSYEYSKETGAEDIPYYPKRLPEDKEVLERYRRLAEGAARISFLGRLGTYRYLDMDKVIAEALDFARRFLTAQRNEESIPVFPNDAL